MNDKRELYGYMIDQSFAKQEYDNLDRFQKHMHQSISLMQYIYQFPQPVTQDMVNQWWEICNGLIADLNMHQAILTNALQNAMVPLYKVDESDEVLETESGEPIYNPDLPF